MGRILVERRRGRRQGRFGLRCGRRRLGQSRTDVWPRRGERRQAGTRFDRRVDGRRLGRDRRGHRRAGVDDAMGDARRRLRQGSAATPAGSGCQAPSWQGLIDSWCKSLSYNGIIRARSNSTPARPYMARLRVFSLLICPSVCPLLQGSDIAFRTASRSWRIVFAKRCIA